MRRDSRIRVCRPHVVAEEIEGEVIAINLESGAYFSFRDSGSVILQRLLAGDATQAEIVQELSGRFSGQPEEIERSVFAFLSQLESEGVIATYEAQSQGDPAGAGGHQAGPVGDRSAFAVPVFEKYTDMEEFLLVDPIHEVDVSAWPAVEHRGSP